MVGRTLQRYRLVEEVGQGGMAVVYRGIDEGLERSVAVKLLHPHLATRIEGPTLRAFAAQHPFDPPELAAACVHALAGALGHAHAHGIVHRDLKPDNVMIQFSGPVPVVKLMDFGIAQILDRDERMTMTGSLMGSPAHMAPEIINGEEADARSDIFSLGTGQLPFDGRSPGELLKKIMEGEYTDPRILKPAVSDRLARVIADALAKDRAVRFQSAKAFQTDLEAVLRESGLELPNEVLSRFLSSPAEGSQEARALVVAHLMEQGRALSEARRTGKALAAFSRVIAVVPGTSEAGAARQAIARLSSRRRWRRRAVTAASVCGVVLLGLMARTSFRENAVAPVAEPDPQLQKKIVQPPAPTPSSSPAPVPVPTPAPPPSPPPVAEPPVQPSSGQLPSAHAATLGSSPALPASPSPIPHPIGERLASISVPPFVAGTHAGMKAPLPRAQGGGTVVAGAPPTAGTAPHVAVQILCDPWANVTIDGQVQTEVTDGRTTPRATPFDAELTVGKHALKFEREHFEALTMDINVTADGRQHVHGLLTPEPAKVTIKSFEGPSDTTIILDNNGLGLEAEYATKPITIHLGQDDRGHPRYDRDVVLRFIHDGYREVPVPLSVRPGEVKSIDVKMVPDG
jgi:serine/threonine-protein kinase